MATLVAVPLVALVGGGLSEPAAGKSARTGRYWIVLGSNRTGESLPYSVRSDGSRLTPLLSHGRGIEAAALSRDGSTIAYTARPGARTNIYVSRADGTGLRRLVQVVEYYAHPALSRDGKLLAVEDHGRISIVGTDGEGRRRLTTGANPDWSPGGSELVFTHGGKLVVQTLSGALRVVARRAGVGAHAVWSPDGRWLAYLSYRGRKGLYVVRPDGRRLHLVAPLASTFAWSPDGRRLAFGDTGYREHPRVGIVGVHGRRLRRLHLDLAPGISGQLPEVAWSPDGRRLVLAAHRPDEEADQIWTVGLDGRGLRRVTSRGANSLIGWTRLAPVLPPARPIPPSAHAIGPHLLATRQPIGALSADGSRVAFVTGGTADCAHVSVWKPGRKAVRRVSPVLPAPCGEGGEGGMYGLVLAGSRVGWAEILGCGNYCEVQLRTATLAGRRAQAVGLEGSFNADEGEPWDYHLHGAGNLLVYNDGSQLFRIGGGHEAILRGGAHAAPVDSVSAGQIAIRETDQVAVLDSQGALVRTFPFTPEDVSAARLDSGHLVVARLAFLEEYDVATGAREVSRPVPAGYALADLDARDGIALLQRPKTIMLLRLADGASFTLKRGHSYLLADLMQRGLYYSYEVGKRGRLVFIPRSSLLRRLR
jgi:Tol biopolymer transport system component